MFTQWIASVEPAAAVEVTLTYVQTLPYAGGGYELVFPMAAGPRPAVVGAASAGAGLRSSGDLGLRVELDAGVPIEAIESPSHPIAIDRPAGAPARAAVTLRPSDPIPNQDFVLRYRVAGAAPRFGVLTHRAGGIGSFLLLAQPPAAPADSQLAPREIVFALDTSSSMRGRPLAKAKDVILPGPARPPRRRHLPDRPVRGPREPARAGADLEQAAQRRPRARLAHRARRGRPRGDPGPRRRARRAARSGAAAARRARDRRERRRRKRRPCAASPQGSARTRGCSRSVLARPSIAPCSRSWQREAVAPRSSSAPTRTAPPPSTRSSGASRRPC